MNLTWGYVFLRMILDLQEKSRQNTRITHIFQQVGWQILGLTKSLGHHGYPNLPKKKHQFLAPIDLLLHPAGYRRLAAFSVKKAVEHLRSPLPHFFAIKMEGITGGTDSIYKAFF
jgi:hypothetical protein